MSQTIELQGAAPSPDPVPGDTPAPPQRGRRRRLLFAAAVVIVVLLGAPLAVGAYVGHQLTSHLTRIHGVFSPLDHRPARASGPAAAAVNILLLGTDRRSDLPTTGQDAEAAAWVPGEQRSDTMMVLHIAADRRSASIISIPRDSWVDVPGHGTAKVNAAYSWGGPSLAVATVEQLTDVRIDHLAIVDWDGYSALIDALGGIDVTIPKTVYDSARKHTWTAGRHHLDGADALLYARERHGLPGGDLDRVRRQQAVLRSLSARALEDTSSPVSAYQLLDTLTQHLSVDDGWSSKSMAQLMLSLRHLKGAGVRYLTIPVTGTGMVGDQSVVFVDKATDATLWRAVRQDQVAAWTDAHPGDALTTTVR